MTRFSQIDGSEDILKSIREYDEQGRIISEKYWDEFDESFSIHKFSYGANGLLSVHSEESEDDYIHDVNEYNYQGDRLISEQHSSMEYGSYMVYYIYDPAGKIDSTYIADAEPRKNAWFHSSGRVDSIVGYTVYDYEQPDNWERVDVEKFEYGKKGVLVHESYCSAYSGCSVHEYIYKKKLKLLDIASGEDAVFSITEFNYKKKLLVKESIKAHEGMEGLVENEVLRYEYTFY